MIVFDVVKARQNDTRRLEWVEDRAVWSCVLSQRNVANLVQRVTLTRSMAPVLSRNAGRDRGRGDSMPTVSP